MAQDQGVATANVAARSTIWILALVGLALVLLGGIDLAAEVKFSVVGEHRPATVLSTAGGIGKQRSVDARANVRLPNGPAMPIEIHDTLGNQHWKEGDTVEVLCARIHADHLSCIADVWFDRYAVDAIMIGAGALALLGAWRLIQGRSKAPRTRPA